MRRLTPLPRLFVCAILGLVAAEPTDTAAQTGCESKRRSCIAGCRAQYFGVDPKRNACVADCIAEAAKCLREQAHGTEVHEALGRPARRAVCTVHVAGRIGFGERNRALPLEAESAL